MNSMRELVSLEIEGLLRERRLADVLDAQTVEITRISPRELQLRVLPVQKNAPRYFNITVSESR